MMPPEHLFRKKLFSLLVPMPLPSRREVHLWYAVPAEIRDPGLLNMYQSILSPTEMDNILHMNADDIKKKALLSRALVRTTLSRYTSCKPDALKFRKNKFGKPELEFKDKQNLKLPVLHFNVSHSPSLIACAVAVDLRIGLDVEEKFRVLKSNPLSFARRYFTQEEVDFLISFSNREIQMQELIKIWTIKEAYVKALGRGFSAAPFREFSVRYVESFNNAKNQRLSNSDFPRIVVNPREAVEHLTLNWRFALLELAKSHPHFASICIEIDDDGEANLPSLKVWKTIPFGTDELVSGTDEVRTIAGETL